MSMDDFCTKVTELAQYADRKESDIRHVIETVLSFDGKISDFIKNLA